MAFWLRENANHSKIFVAPSQFNMIKGNCQTKSVAAVMNRSRENEIQSKSKIEAIITFKGNSGMEYVSHRRSSRYLRINHQHSSSSLGTTSPSPFLWAGFGGPGR